MKERPILYTGSMVRSILEDRKTMTRRVCKEQPYPNGFHFDGRDFLCHNDYLPPSAMLMDGQSGSYTTSNLEGWESECPYGQPGDRLWVREAFSGPWEWRTIPPAGWGWDTGQRPPIWYWADGNPPQGDWTRPKPSIHMPRWASRLLLEITDVRVERVQSISQMDALAEGIDTEGADYIEGENLQSAGSPISPERFAFARLWDSINAKRGFGWEANPWTWVIEFRRVAQ